MAVVGPDFPKCPACHQDMKSISLKDVPAASVREMVRFNRFQPLNPNYWYECEDHGVILHKIAVKAK